MFHLSTADVLPAIHDLKTMLEVASEAADLDGKRTLAYFNAHVRVETKADASPVTIADRESELVIRARIRASHPEHSILGEEGGLEMGDPDFKWIIDPFTDWTGERTIYSRDGFGTNGSLHETVLKESA